MTKGLIRNIIINLTSFIHYFTYNTIGIIRDNGPQFKTKETERNESGSFDTGLQSLKLYNIIIKWLLFKIFVVRTNYG